jgi:hypothetical protein
LQETERHLRKAWEVIDAAIEIDDAYQGYEFNSIYLFIFYFIFLLFLFYINFIYFFFSFISVLPKQSAPQDLIDQKNSEIENSLLHGLITAEQGKNIFSFKFIYYYFFLLVSFSNDINGPTCKYKQFSDNNNTKYNPTKSK